MSSFAELTWSFGLRNHQGLYLSAETFGFRVNCSGKVMRKKQIFFLEQVGGKTFIRTHLNRYLTFKEDGRFLADSEVKGTDEEVVIEPQADGRWAIRTVRGFYVGGTGEKLDAFSKKLDADRLWTVQLAIHPQVCIRNINRKRYVHLSGDKLTTDEDVPWGSDAVITIVYHEDGKYSLETDDGRFLSATSDLKPVADESCKFTLEFYENNMVAFKCSNGKYITAVGGTGILKGGKDGKDGLSKDELFVMEDSQPQFKLKNIKWMKFASVKSAVEVRCNQSEATDSEVFQFEINPDTKQWSICSKKSMFWSCLPDGSIQAVTTKQNRGAREWFTADWQGARLTLKACNGKLVSVLPNGGCYASEEAQTDASTFQFEIINRPKLVLRGEHGFVASLPSGMIECNKSVPEIYTMHVAAGICHISGTNGRYWKINGEQDISVAGTEPEAFTFEFVEHSKFVIRCKNGKLVQGQGNGGFAATGTAVDVSTLWEY